MCGLWALFNAIGDDKHLRKLVNNLLKRIRHRGPDQTGISHFINDDKKHHFICHERLGIVDPFLGEQPLFDESGHICVAAVGEIYNHLEIRDKLNKTHQYLGHGDCQIIPHMYEEMDIYTIANTLSGKFGFVLYDLKLDRYYIVRDHLGIIPLYYGRGHHGEFFVCSELKGFHDHASSIEILLPGHYYDSELKKQVRWYNPIHYNFDIIPEKKVDLKILRDLLISSVRKRLMVDVPFGVLLSGGLDSSIIASITKKIFAEDYMKKHMDDYLLQRELHSFCIGLENSPDLKASREVAKFLKTVHHEFVFTVQQGIDAISEVIYFTETFNPTTIRASTPMFLMARKIKGLGIKMVLTGEGSDEIFGGYLYFHKAPNKKEFHHENIRKLQDLYKYDLLRANKSLMAWGIEGRVPFLDKDFVEYCMSIDPEAKLVNEEHKNIEKWVLRSAFDTEEDPFLPKEILWRQKEQFSDGVGYNWVDGLKSYIETQVSDEDLINAHLRFPIMTPPTKEAFYYRMVYEQHFPTMAAVCTVPQNKSIACSTEKAVEWDEAFKKNVDESGRAVLGIHLTTGTSEELNVNRNANEFDIPSLARKSEKVLADLRFKNK